ncbi:MAG: hypothetical protein R2778_11120 [Saprospiraceae bacterium]
MYGVVQRYEKALQHPDQVQSLQDAMAEMDQKQAWSFEARVKEFLFRFRMDNFEQKVGTLSGGQQKRLALVKILLRRT